VSHILAKGSSCRPGNLPVSFERRIFVELEPEASYGGPRNSPSLDMRSRWYQSWYQTERN
jgi:hypothetical protein